MRIWSHRPPLLYLALFFAAYVLGGGFATALGIVPGTNVSIWPPGGVFIATLILTSPYNWPWWILVGCPAELLGQFLWWHSPLPAAVIMYLGNALEAVVGAWLVNRICGRAVRLETLQEVLAFVVLGAGVAPVISATIGSATLAWFGVKSQTFAGVWPLWWIGDATGILIVAPLVLVVVQNWRGKAQLSTARWIEAGVLGLIFLGVAAVTLSGYLPFAYIIMPPLLWAAVRFEFKGAALTLSLLALITAVFTISGASQFIGDAETQRQKQIMLQLFLAVSALSALIVAAISRQHRQALLTLRRSERQLQQLIDTVPAIMWSTTPEGIPCYLNKRATDVTGATLKDLIAPDGSRSLTVIHPDDRDAIDQAMARSFETGAPFVGRYRQRRADGPHRWVESRAEPLRDDSGNIVQWYGVSVDIHDLVTAQEALRDRERELSQLVNMVPVHIRRMTPQGEPTFFNKRLMDFFGLGDVADLDKPSMSRLAAIIQGLVHPDDAPSLLGTARRSFASGEPFSMKYRMRRADGAHRWVDTRGEPLRNQNGAIAQWYVISLDIDDEMRAQETVRNREAELSQLVDMVPSLLWRLNPDGEPNYFNKRTIDFLGLDAADYDKPGMSRLAATLAAIIHPDDAAAVTEGLNHSLVTGEPFSMTYRLRRADGVYRWVSGRAEPMRDESGCIVQWYGLAHDIDDQMRAEEALRQSERRLQQMIDAVPVYILSFSAAGEPTYINKRYQDYLGLSVSHFDSLQEQQRAIIHPEDFAEMYGTLSNCFQTGAPFLMRYRRRGKDGIYRWTEGRAEPLHDQDGKIVQWYAVSLDIEDETRAQEALRQASAKLAQATQAASLAELSASIAHEVNQPLAAIVANSHACQRWLSAEPANVERAKITVERIIRDANSAADVVARIRALFRQSVEPRISTPLSGAIAEARSLMAEEAARRRVRMDIDVEGNLPLVAFDRVQIQQVLINLIRNGFDAMDSTPDDRVLGMRARRNGASIQIEIRDRGAGVEFPDKMFEPFFTTKQNGMGMGLAICRSIVESHGGRLWAENSIPHGATFIFTLPVEEKAAS